MVRGCAGLDSHDARRQLLEERQDISTFELAADDQVPCGVDAVDLKDRLRNIETDCRDRLHVQLSRSVAAPSATIQRHLRAGGGAVHSIKSGLWR